MPYYFLEKGEMVPVKNGDMLMECNKYCYWVLLDKGIEDWDVEVDEYSDPEGIWAYLFVFDKEKQKMVWTICDPHPDMFMESCVKLLDASHPDNIWNQYWKGF